MGNAANLCVQFFVENHITYKNTINRRKVKKKAKRECSGHVLIGTFLKLPIFCEYCCEYMWGTMAYRCKACDVLLHKACESQVGFDCPGVDHGRIKDDADLAMHVFKERKADSGNCDQCEQTYTHRVNFCKECSMRVHRGCLPFVPKGDLVLSWILSSLSF